MEVFMRLIKKLGRITGAFSLALAMTVSSMPSAFTVSQAAVPKTQAL
jgi:hypothetical protein